MPRYVTSPRYRVDIGPHVFPTEKYDLIRRRLVDHDGARAEDFVEPDLADEKDVLRVHTRDYFEKCRDGRLTPQDILRLELPWSAGLFEAASRCVQGSIVAGRMAMAYGAGLHIGGGFHHAMPDHGEGFCVFNDHAVAIRALQAEGTIERALVIDCDLHHGNGTAAVFAGDPTVQTFSIHQENIYPPVKPPSTVDVGLGPGTDDAVYLEALAEKAIPMFGASRPDLVVYVAGADAYREDQLGSLLISKAGLRQRDRLVVEACREVGAAILVVLAGGYAVHVADTVDIHLASIRATAGLWRA